MSIKCWFQCVSLNLKVRKIQIILQFQSFLSCPTLWDLSYSLPGSSVLGIFQGRILEWVAIPSPGDLADPEIKSGLLCPLHCRRILYHCATWEVVQLILYNACIVLWNVLLLIMFTLISVCFYYCAILKSVVFIQLCRLTFVYMGTCLL